MIRVPPAPPELTAPEILDIDSQLDAVRDMHFDLDMMPLDFHVDPIDIDMDFDMAPMAIDMPEMDMDFDMLMPAMPTMPPMAPMAL
ncbi:MAG TPA: hypothetical protein VGG76_09185, partial [Gemmatimonadaceae bacterium]